ncbi:cobalamin biosynthesis protein CbiE [Gordoniibacillus kamchatkensis]|uniref:Cobalamin biosynthesis protein CbiE n=1 Tax=Gordoniibacillus kamchatkensis TaxID=1590651 RepID=A0ABR5AC69_9BACL|nr:bifunctional cobalt-precorrin-7 (C(5))-methyltransferase/cobalt-precorrin-6B (C(15))-methyltransferase [Paenibacillus sp. VKM B-2647]KIL38651.1 cobalamin biosynthesis protein CbiE [Paenibacillus sp. VKM B-2647]
MDKRIAIIGIGDDGADSLLPRYVERIERSQRLVGGERQLAFFPRYEGEKVVIKSGLAELADMLAGSDKDTVVLASGDPLFYGIGGYLAKKCGAEVYPYVSSVQLAFAHMGESWQDAAVYSLHGRSIAGLAQKIDGQGKIALLTDERNSPQRIAEYLLHFGMSEYRAFVAEHLGGDKERCRWFELEELAAGGVECSPLNVVVLRRTGPSPQWTLGIEDEAFAQRKPDKGLITKREVRILSIAALGLKPDSVVWDIGTCTGSVAIEAARLCRDGAVYAIEKNEDDLANCLENMRKFRTDFTAVHGKAPNGLEQFPDPDAVFIGGSGGEMQELLRVCCTRLKPGGRIVLNAVTIENLFEAQQAFLAQGYRVDISMIQAARSKPILNMTRLEAMNPVYIVTARHGGDKEREEQP